MTPINDNSQFYVGNNSKNKTIHFEYITEYTTGVPISSMHVVEPNEWRLFQCNTYVEIKSSEMPPNHRIKFDLSEPCGFTLKPLL